MRIYSRFAITAMVVFIAAGAFLQAGTKDIPLELPKPDGKPADSKKPVKVYILAGQSNMVGMGDISGASPMYPSIFLSADPAVIPGAMPMGRSGLASHGVYQSADPKADKGAMVAVYSGAYDPNVDYTKMTPVKTVTVALGTVTASIPALDGPSTPIVTAFIDVPASGNYTVHAGYEDSTYAVVSLDGKEVYRRDPGGKPVITKVALEAGKRYPVRIIYFKGSPIRQAQGRSAAFWLEQVDLTGRGDLNYLTKTEKKFKYLLDEKGDWAARSDVSYTDPRLFPTRASSLLSATSNNGKSIGPELGFGSVMGTFHDEQVLLIKTSNGNRSLNWDFRPPSSGSTGAPGASEWEGLEYRLMVKGVRDTLQQIDKVVPGYAGQGYEIAGFFWFQGHKDSGSAKAEYEKHLVNLISDLRKEFNVPKMPAVVATVGFGGYRITQGSWKGVWEAQMAVGDPKQHPELAGNVASVDTRDFWREVDESPRSQDYHYNRNPETYLLVGETAGREMVKLMGGKAESFPKSDREAKTSAAMAAEAAKPVPTSEQKAASQAAVRPMILDGLLVSFLADPRNQKSIQDALKGVKPARPSSILVDVIDEAADFFRTAGIRDYDWKPIKADMKGGKWDYYGFDLPAGTDKSKGISDLKMTCPAGMENWFSPDFDSAKAGWKTGEAPFGVEKDTVEYPEWFKGSKRSTPKTICENDVVLLRQSFDIPALKEGSRYRIRVTGSIHANSGEGYAIYVNGKLLAETKEGILAWRKQGGLARGGHISGEFLNDFKGGKVTIAVSNFLMNNASNKGFVPARAPLSVTLEEMVIPAQVLEVK